MELISEIIIWMFIVKCFFIGSEFSFIKWYKYGSKYYTWYFNQPTFEDFLNWEMKYDAEQRSEV